MFGGKMATTPSWLSCLKPHVFWVFGQLRHFNFSGPGATGFVLSQEGDIRPPFFVYGKAGPTVLATPLGPWSSAPHLAAFEKAGKTFTCLYLTRARAFQLAPLTPSSAALKAAFASCPVRPRTQARAACQPFPASSAAPKRRARLVPRGHPLAFWGRACYNRP